AGKMGWYEFMEIMEKAKDMNLKNGHQEYPQALAFFIWAIGRTILLHIEQNIQKNTTHYTEKRNIKIKPKFNPFLPE
ncbi:hypothetical protein ACJX0J_007716, partial [Zea mays]